MSSRDTMSIDKPQSAWGRFWFQPSDPTTLGFMRIVTGLLVLYIHLSYCFDLQTFFGSNGWWDKKEALWNRNELPFMLMPWNWNEYKPMLQLPQLSHSRTAVFDFLKHLPANHQQRREALRYLDFNIRTTLRAVNEQGREIGEANFIASLEFLKRAAELTTAERQAMAVGMSNEKLNPKQLLITVLPDYFQFYSPQQRAQFWRDCQELLRYMPANDTNFILVIDWLRSLGAEDRKEVIEYLDGLPDGAEGLKTLEYYEHWKVDPREAFVRGRTTFSLWFHVFDPTTMWVCHILILFVILLFTLGFATRVTSVMTWLAALFYIHRNNSILFGMDSMMNVLLFYLMIGPSGAALSIDRLIARYRAARAIFRAGHQPVPWAEAVLAGPRPSATANFTIRLIQIHFCFIYMASGLAKLKGFMWWNTTATWYTIGNPEFSPIYYPQYESMLRLLAKSKVSLLIVFGMMSYFTLIVEISLPFLIWTRARPVMVCLGVFLHSGIAWIMGLTCFGLLMMSMLLSYIPAAVIRERLTWAPGSGSRFAVHYNGRNSRHGKVVAFLRALDFAGQIVFHDDSLKKPDYDTPVQIIDESHHAVTGDEIVSYSMRKLVFPRLFVYIPGVEFLVRRLVNVSASDDLARKQADYQHAALQSKSKS